jgi:hypothetical protein
VVFDYICASAWWPAKRSIHGQVSVEQGANGGENYRFALDQDRVGDFLGTHGLRLDEEHDVPDLRKHFLGGAGGNGIYSRTRIVVAAKP